MLEAEFGQALFVRHARGVMPAEAGRRLGERAIEILRHLVESMSGFLREWAERGRIDLSVIYETPPSPALRTEVLETEELFLISLPDVARQFCGMVPFGGLRALLDRRRRGAP